MDLITLISNGLSLMKTALYVSLFLAPSVAAFAADTPSNPFMITVRQEVELFQAITALDQGGSKIIDGKEAHIPFQFSSGVRWTLSGDLDSVKGAYDRFESLSSQKQGEEAAKQKKDDMAAQAKMNAAVDADLTAILNMAADPQPKIKKVSLADLQLDTNPIPMSILTKLRPIISEE